MIRRRTALREIDRPDGESLGRHASPSARQEPLPLSAAFRSCSGALQSAALFSCIINLLMLVGPLFMLQIYDRVLASKSVPTLIALTILVGGLFIFLGLFDLIRTRIAARTARRVDEQIHGPLFIAALEHEVRRNHHGQTHPLRDLDTVRQFLSGPSLNTLFDLPWTPIYLGVIFLLHPHLGVFALVGTFLLAVLVLLNDRWSGNLFRRSAASTALSHRTAEECSRNAAAIRAMGMQAAMQIRWQEIHGKALDDHIAAADRNGALSAAARTLRLFLQSAILALGAYLAIQQEITAGAIVTASIILARASAPIEQGIAHWRSIVQFRTAVPRLERVFADLDERRPRMALPAPKGYLAVEGLVVAPPGEQKPILRQISFSLEPGQALGVIGPTGAGKSTLARALVNVWVPLAGTISIDGAPFNQWDADELGRSLGYLPQEVELFDGTFDENIARFEADASADAVIHAAKLAGVHELILGFPEGYKSRIGEAGAKLSAGQRQRIGLARALYGNPALVVMDEPNANLDAIGEAALSHAIRVLKKRGATVVVIAHRPSAIASVDFILSLNDGRQFAFGRKDDVLGRLAGNGNPSREQPANA
jgi:PrtD family type I secretion system ABC transporter